jgi:IrrE N-terminal-like domain
MGTSWEMLSGNTRRFALRMGLQEDPNVGQGATSDESASWGYIELWILGQNIFAHGELGDTVDGVHWYLLPFLEWVAENWEPLLHEERPPNQNSAETAVDSLHLNRFPPRSLTRPDAEANWEKQWDSWRRRHAVRAAREGGLFPDVVIRRWRDEVEVSWRPTLLPGVPKEVGYEFLVPHGHARLEPLEVAHPLYTVVTELAAELQNRDPTSLRFRALASRLADLKTVERQEIRVAWLAGLGVDPAGVLSRWRSLVERLASATEGIRDAVLGGQADGLVVTAAPTAALLFGSASPTIRAVDVDALLGLVTDAIEEPFEHTLGGLARPEPFRTSLEVVQQAYELADEVLESVGWTGRFVDVEAIVYGLGIVVRTVDLSDKDLRAVAVAGRPFRSTIGLNTGYRWSRSATRRFSLAHELCHILFDQSHRQRVAVASGVWAPRDIERRANAFAAEFLMPPAAIEQVIRDDQLEIETVDGMAALAEALGTSASATLEHTFNTGFIDRATREALVEAFHWTRLSP